MADTQQRILVITELFMPTKGGTAVWFDEVYRRLGRKGVHIVTAQVPDSAAHDTAHPNTIHRLDLKRSPWLRPESLAMYLKLWFKSVALMLTQRLGAVHAGRVLPEGLVGWCVARLFRKPLVIYAHGEEITTWRQSGKFKAMCFAYRHAETVIANSDFTKAELLKIGVRERQIVMIHPGVDIERFRPGLRCDDLRARVGCGESGELLLSVGRLSRRKGFDQVVRCMQRLLPDHPQLHYAIIGIGEDREYLENLARECGVDQHVHLLGHVAVEDLPRWYNAADVFVMPNREIAGDTEGFGMVFIEASACGTPVVAGSAGGTASSVSEGVSGFRVDGSSVREVGDVLNRLLSDQSLVRSIGEQGRNWAVSNFSWGSVVQKVAMLDTKPPRNATARPLRVLYFAGTHGDWGGAGRVLFTTLSLLDRSRVEPIVALPMEGPAQALLDGMQIEYVLWGPLTEYRSPFQYLGGILRTVLWLRRRRIDIVDMNRANNWRPAEHLAARLARVPIVTHFHTVNLDRAPATHHSTVIAAVSEFVATHSDTMNVPVHVIYNSVNVEKFGRGTNVRQELGVGNDQILVTFAGQIRRIKGVDLFVDAAQKVRGDNVRYLIAGACRKGAGIDDAYIEPELRELISVDERIIYAGYRDDMPNVYHSSDIVVVPSRWEEPFGLILIEAGAAAKAVVATRVGGIPEVVLPDITGLLVKPNDIEELAKAIQRLVDSKDLRESMGRAARDRVTAEFVRKPVIELERLYESL